MTQSRIIALLTDIGLADAYVGTMKGVMLAISPHARLVDITHAITPQNVRQAAYALTTAYRYFPPDTVFLVVVDPGVGTARAPIAVATDHGIFVAPDNGVLSYALAQSPSRASVILQNPAYRLPNVSQTFHGRDIFSPAAAHLANGVPITDLGPPLPALKMLDWPRLEIGVTHLRGEALHIDHFGNVITSIGHLTWIAADELQLDPQFGSDQPAPTILRASHCRIEIAGKTLTPIRATYGAVAPGTLIALVGSFGQLEIGINQGHAADALGISLGDPVVVTLIE